MNRSQVKKCYLSIFVALLVTPQPKAFAQQLSSPLTVCELEMNQVQLIDEGKPRKLTVLKSDVINDSDFFVQVGSFNESTQASGQQRLLSGKPPIKDYFAGSLEGIWQMRVNQADLQFVKANYTVAVADPKVGSPFNKVETQPLQIKQARVCPDNTVVVQSGVILRFSELFKFAEGNFEAQVNVCVETKDRNC
jgi:hypothetical protein